MRLILERLILWYQTVAEAMLMNNIQNRSEQRTEFFSPEQPQERYNVILDSKRISEIAYFDSKETSLFLASQGGSYVTP